MRHTPSNDNSAYSQVILSSPSCWCVCAEALRVRCKSERSRWRTVERSMTQLENLVAMVTEPASSEKCRLNLFYCVRPPPIWMLQVVCVRSYTLKVLRKLR